MAYQGQENRKFKKESLEGFTVYPEDPKYGTLIGIPVGKDKFAWKFGYQKAKAIVENCEKIRAWVESQEQKRVS